MNILVRNAHTFFSKKKEFVLFIPFPIRTTFFFSDGKKWAHVQCVWWLPDIKFEDGKQLEKMRSLDKISVCSLSTHHASFNSSLAMLCLFLQCEITKNIKLPLV